MRYLRIAPNQVSALEAISKFPDEKFQEIAESLVAQSRPSIRPSVLFGRVSELSEDESFSRALCSQLVSLATFKRIGKGSTKDVIQALVDGIGRSAEMSEEATEWYKSNQDLLERLLDCESIVLPAKALHLSTDYSKLYSSANVVTDIRSVFDGDRDVVAGKVITQTLRVHYTGAQDEQREISLAMSKDEIELLIDELKQAEEKAEYLKKYYGEKSDGDVFVVGEEAYGFG